MRRLVLVLPLMLALIAPSALAPPPAGAQPATPPPLVLRTVAGTGPLASFTDGEPASSLPGLRTSVLTSGTLYFDHIGLRSLDVVTGTLDTVAVPSSSELRMPLDAEGDRLLATSEIIDLRTGAVRALPPGREGDSALAGALEGDAVALVVGSSLGLPPSLDVIDLTAGTRRRLVDEVEYVGGIALADDVVYLGEEGGVTAYPLDGTSPQRVAGTGRRELSADEGPATSIPSSVSGLDVADGLLYVGERNRIAEVDLATGALRTIAGTGQPPSGEPPQVVELSSTPQPAGSVDLGSAALHVADGILAFELAADDLTVATAVVDLAQGAVRQVVPSGTDFYPSEDDDGPATAALLPQPRGLAVDGDRSFVADIGPAGGIVHEIDLDGDEISTLVAPTGDGGLLDLLDPVGLEVADGELYIADRGRGLVVALDLGSGQSRLVAGGGAATEDGADAKGAFIGLASSVAVTPEAVVIGSEEVRVVDRASGTIRTLDEVGPATPYDAARPRGVGTIDAVWQVADADGQVYAGDSLGGRVLRVPLGGGQPELLAEGFASDAERLSDLTLGRDRLLVGYDGGPLSSRVVALETTRRAEPQPVAGGGIFSFDRLFSPDGTPAAGNVLYGGLALDVDDAGRLLALEQGNHRLRRLEAAQASPERQFGAERTATAAAISAAAFPDGAPVAFVVGGASFEDALVAGPAAAQLGGPLLLAFADRLPEATAAELDRLRPQQVVVVGGTVAVSDAVLEELRSRTGAEVVRFAGADVAGTSVEVARRFLPQSDVVYLATQDDFPDGLAAGVAAARDGAPVLLTAPDSLSAVVAEELQRRQPDAVVVLGGIAAVDPAVDAQVRALGVGEVRRLRGLSRNGTAGAIAQTFASADVVFVATGFQFPDALAAVPAAAAAGAPVLLVQTDAVHPETEQQLRRLRPRRIVVLGGRAAVTDVTLGALRGYLR